MQWQQLLEKLLQPVKMNNASKTGLGKNGNSSRGSWFMTEMDFQEFPFDVHNCYWKLRNWLGWIKYVKLNQPRIWYHQNGRAANSAERTEIELRSNKLNFNAYFNSNKSSIINENGYNYSEAAIQITLKRNKIGFLKIISGYYVTTGTFSTMSLLSFFVDPSVVNFFWYIVRNYIANFVQN